MDNLINLINDLDTKAVQDMETNADNFIEGGELTGSDMKRLEEMKASRQTELMVTESGIDGADVQHTMSEYVKTLNKRVTVVQDALGNDRTLKTLNNGDIVADIDKLKADARDTALKTYRSMSVKDALDLTDDEYMAVNDEAIDALLSYFNIDKLTSEVVMPKLKKMTLKQIANILPAQFVSLYINDSELLANNSIAKDRLIATIGYLIVTGPEMDYLNEYIDDENKLALVEKRILQCQIDFTKMIEDENVLSDIVAKTVQIAPADTSFWSKYIKLPNRIHNDFAQRVVIQEEYKKSYEKLLDDPEYNGSPAALAVIQREIDETNNKIEVYKDVTKLELMTELYDALYIRYTTGAKLSHKFLIKETISAIDRAKRCKQNVPYPGFRGTETKTDIMFKHYMAAYTGMIENYNKTLINVIAKESENPSENTETDVIPIYLDGVPGDTVAKVFSALLAILMGRIMKKLSTHNSTKYDAILLDSYFTLFCKLGMDIYTMTDVWTMMKPLVEYVIKNVKLDQKW